VPDIKTKSKRTFTSLVRRPYQDAIAVILKTHDYHMEMSSRGIDKEWHSNMAERLRQYTIDLKDYIVRLEDGHDRENTET
jgi:hypothetical protein|tara:strand:- start:273 stop:512 length:240 start_codon:yes stop_codon:yes gene_type:complete